MILNDVCAENTKETFSDHPALGGLRTRRTREHHKGPKVTWPEFGLTEEPAIIRILDTMI